MHRALLLLLRLRITGAIRRGLRVMKSPKGVVFSVLGGFLLLMWLGPMLLSLLFRRPERDPEMLLLIGPPILLGLCVMNAIARISQGAVYFSPAEIDFLFAGPFKRRDLLLYKLVSVVASALALGVFFALVLTGVSLQLVTAAVGLGLAMLFASFVGIASAQAKELLATRSLALMRMVGVGVAGVGLLLIAAPLATLPEGLSLTEAARTVFEAPTVRVLLAPLAVFIQIVTAASPTLFALWTAVALVMVGAVFLLMVSLNASSMEAALHASRRQYERLEQAKRTGGLVAWKRAARWRIPALARMGGVGPIMQRQLTTALRSARSIALLVLLMLAAIITLAIWSRATDQGGHVSTVLIGPGIFMFFFMVTMLRFDFRGDLDQIEWLKMLPIPSMKLAAAQVLSPVLLMTLAQWTLLAAVAICFGHSRLAAVAAVALVPLNLLLVGMENLMFLVYPMRPAAARMMDLQTLGRNMVLVFARGLIIGPVLLVTGGLGAAGYFLAGGSWPAAIIVGWIVLAGLSLGTLPAVAMAFRRFDVSADMPT